MTEGDRWTVRGLAEAAWTLLRDRGFDHARLEADLLLGEVLGLDRVGLYTRWDMPVDDDKRAAFRALVKRRLAHEPIAYILGRRDFLDATFTVGPGVLVPRPETELLVTLAIAWLEERGAGTGEGEGERVLDLGIGSGCILASILLARPQATGVGTDLSAAALAIARENGARLGVADRWALREGDLWSGLSAADLRTPFDLVVSNPPYVERAERDRLAPDVRDHEPELALFAPGDALALHRRILSGHAEVLGPDGLILLELGAGTGEALGSWLEAALPGLAWGLVRDLAGHDRVFAAARTALPARIARHCEPSRAS